MSSELANPPIGRPNGTLDRASPRLSVVTTLYKSQDTVREFHQRMSVAAHRLSGDYELIMVDDGSPDNSLRIALELCNSDPRLKVIELSRNFGHHRAMMTGLEEARGDLVFLIDSDLEEPPELIEPFHDQLQAESLDVVYGYQERRKGGLIERISGWLAYSIMQLLLPVRMPRNHTTVRLMRNRYVRALVSHKERNTAIGGLWVITGFRQAGHAINKGSRGRSTYPLHRRYYFLIESITSFSELPLLMVFYLGFMIMIASAAIGAYLVVLWFTGDLLPGWVSTMVTIWFLGGLNVFCIGVVGLYVSRIFIETKNRPYTIIRQIHGAETQKAGARAISPERDPRATEADQSAGIHQELK